MNFLSDEILLHIFTFLPTRDVFRCGKVNKHWRGLTKDKKLYEVVDLSFCTIPSRTLATLLRRGTTTLILKKSTVTDPKSWSNIFSPPNKLVEIDASHAIISSRVLGLLMKRSPNVAFLRVRGCKISLTCIEALSNNPHLRKLDLSSTDIWCLSGIAFKAKLLEEIDVSHVPGDQLSDVESLSLRRVRATNSDYHYVDIKTMLKNCPNITHLDISHNYIGPQGVKKLELEFPNLVELTNNLKEDFVETNRGYLSDASRYYDSDSDSSIQSSPIPSSRSSSPIPSSRSSSPFPSLSTSSCLTDRSDSDS